MKQNERLLVYAVTGFLALILVIAVLFGSEPANAATGKGKVASPGLSEILNRKQDSENKLDATKTGVDPDADARLAAELAKQNGPKIGGAGRSEQPLIARPQAASAVVARALGTSRRDRIVRFVRAKRGDAFETLVRRWCGTTEPYLKEALCLNEDTTMLREGQEVAVPWVEDEVLAALIAAQAPRTLAGNRSSGGSSNGIGPSPSANQLPGNPVAGTPTPSVGGPSFAMPGSRPAGSGPEGNAPASGDPAGNTAAAPSVSYKVKPGDSLWKIAANRYGKRNADRMIRTIKGMNPGLTDSLQVDQQINLPPKTE